jgi:uncharacterized protein (TIGR02421 family)
MNELPATTPESSVKSRRSVHERVACHEISTQIFEAQKDLRVLSNIGWSASVEELFHSGNSIDKALHAHYAEKPIRFDLHDKLQEFKKIERDVRERLGGSVLESVLIGRIQDHMAVAQLISHRGDPEFSRWSRRLWGSTRDKIFSDGTTVGEFAKSLRQLIKMLITPEQRKGYARVISAEAAAELMRAHFSKVHLSEFIKVIVSDTITANAAASVGKIKLRKNAMFSFKDIEVLIYHEAYTHVATTHNGRAQPFAKFLGFQSARCTSTQEGLAVLMEIVSNTTYPQRILKIADRVIATSLAEDGADPKTVYDELSNEGYGELEAYQLMSRVFRGTSLSGGQAFTKDVAYLKGLVECYNFVQYCLIRNKTEYIPFLFCGKLNLDEVPALYAAVQEGLVVKPKWIPSQFQDLSSLSSWFISAAALGQMVDPGYHEKFGRMLEEHSVPHG